MLVRGIFVWPASVFGKRKNSRFGAFLGARWVPFLWVIPNHFYIYRNKYLDLSK